jgi:hypothetical protein
MSGPTGAQTQVQEEDIATMKQYDQEMQTQYADQTALYKQVNSVLQPILQAGPNQQGFSASETNNLNAQAVEGTATNYAGAAKAAGDQMAAEGGGENPLPSGGQTQLQEEVASSAAQQESSQESQIQQADYAQGYSEFENAESGEMAIATGEDPLGYASATNTADSTAGSMANTIAAQDTSWENAAIGAVGSIGGAVVGENPGGIFD